MPYFNVLAFSDVVIFCSTRTGKPCDALLTLYLFCSFSVVLVVFWPPHTTWSLSQLVDLCMDLRQNSELLDWDGWGQADYDLIILNLISQPLTKQQPIWGFNEKQNSQGTFGCPSQTIKEESPSTPLQTSRTDRIILHSSIYHVMLDQSVVIVIHQRRIRRADSGQGKLQGEQM